MSYVREAAPRRSRSVALMRAYPRRRGFGDNSAEISSIGNTVGAAIGIPGAGSIINSALSIFGGNPATGANAQRQAAVYTLYGEAMTAPGSQSSTDAAVALYTIANQVYDPIANVQRNNPQSTRTYAAEALQALASQGWENVNSLQPMYTGITQSGQIYSPNPGTGQQQLVATRPITGAVVAGGRGMSPMLLLLLLGGGLLLMRGGGRATATVQANRRRHHANRRRRGHRGHRRAGR